MCGIARRKGLALLGLSPLARGDAALLQHPTLLQVAAAQQKTPAQARAQPRRVVAAWQR